MHIKIEYMAEKKNFMLRLNVEQYKAIEKWAADEFRSVNGQIEYLLQEALKAKKRLPKTDNKSTTNSKK